MWLMPFPKDIVDSLVSWTNPKGKVNNSELELTRGKVHSDCVAQYFVVTPLFSAYKACKERGRAVYEGNRVPRLIKKRNVKTPVYSINTVASQEAK